MTKDTEGQEPAEEGEAKADAPATDGGDSSPDQGESKSDEAKSDEAKSDEAKSDEAKSEGEADESKSEGEADEAKSEGEADESKSEGEADEAKSDEAKSEGEADEAKSDEAKSDGESGADSLPRPSGEVLIEAENLCKYYGEFTAIEDVSLEVRRGQVVAFLGPNGAGKSTTMKILTGVLAADRGQARIGGLSVVHNRIEVAQRLGYLPETGPLYQEMTPLELLRFYGEARGLGRQRAEERIEKLVERLDLKTVLGKAIAKLSKGYRQRVGLAQAMLHEPDVLIMDEPTSGLDPNQIRDVRRIIREFARDKAILLSTHILQEVEAVADRVVFISRGRIVFQGDVAALREAGEGSLDRAFAHHTGVRYEEVQA